MRGKFLALLTLCACVIMALAQPSAASLQAPAATVALVADAGFNGYVKPDRWIPVRVTVNSTEAIDGEIAVSTTPDRSRRYGATLSLARNVRKQITLYSPPATGPIEALFIDNVSMTRL